MKNYLRSWLIDRLITSGMALMIMAMLAYPFWLVGEYTTMGMQITTILILIGLGVLFFCIIGMDLLYICLVYKYGLQETFNRLFEARFALCETKRSMRHLSSLIDNNAAVSRRNEHMEASAHLGETQCMLEKRIDELEATLLRVIRWTPHHVRNGQVF